MLDGGFIGCSFIGLVDHSISSPGFIFMGREISLVFVLFLWWFFYRPLGRSAFDCYRANS